MPKVNDNPPEKQAVRVVASGVDSLYLGYAFDVADRWTRDLEQVKKAADRARKAGKDPRTGEPLFADPDPVTIAGVPWLVRPYGAAAAPYLAWHERIGQWALNPEAMNRAPHLQVKLFALALWRDPTAQLVALVDRLAAAMSREGTWERRYVQRVDVAVDFQGWTPEVDDFERFVRNGNPTSAMYMDGDLKKSHVPKGKVINPEMDTAIEEYLEHPSLWMRWKLSGFRFGASGVVVRLYCKSEEIKVSGKPWFIPIWERSGVYVGEEPVWRLEIQLPHSYLKDLHLTETSEPLDSVEAVLAHLGDAWRTVLTDRIRLTLADASRNTRSTVNPAWEALAQTDQIDGVCDGGKVTTVEQDRMTAEQLVPKVRGYVASWASLAGEDELDDAILRVHEEIRDLCNEQKRPFHRIVKDKKKAREAIRERVTDFDINARAFQRKRERESALV